MMKLLLFIVLLYCNNLCAQDLDNLLQSQPAHNNECFSTINGFKTIAEDKLHKILHASNIDHFDISIDAVYLKIFHNIQYCIYDFSYDTESKKYKVLLQYLNHDDVHSNEYIEINGSYKIYASFVAAKQNILPGEKISSEDLQYVVTQEPSGNYLTNINDAVGRVSKNTIMAGKLINFDYLTTKTLITKGKKVNVIYNKKSINLKMTAIALESGKKGDNIKIHNSKSNTTIYATVLDDDTVVVGDD